MFLDLAKLDVVYGGWKNLSRSRQGWEWANLGAY